MRCTNDFSDTGSAEPGKRHAGYRSSSDILADAQVKIEQNVRSSWQGPQAVFIKHSAGGGKGVALVKWAIMYITVILITGFMRIGICT